MFDVVAKSMTAPERKRSVEICTRENIKACLQDKLTWYSFFKK